jgi:TolB protein
MARLVLLVTILVLLALAGPAGATYPGRSGAIAYYSNASSEDGPRSINLLVKKPFGDQTERLLLTCASADGDPGPPDCPVSSFRSPAYSPDGSKIVFDAGKQLAIVDADGRHLTLLSQTTQDDGNPAFTTNGRRIVFDGPNGRGGIDVYERLADGAPALLLVANAADPARSSRNQLAFVRDGAVYVADARGQNVHRVAAGWAPDWAPGGGRLAIVRRPRGQVLPQAGALYTVRIGGHGLLRLGNVRDAIDPTWSPDGRWIAYGRPDEGIFFRRVARHGQPRLLVESQYGDTGSHVEGTPAWRPLVGR